MTEVRTTSATGGQKGVKPERFSLIPPEALGILAELYGKGAEKYDAHNWRKGYDWSKSYDALQRHLNAFWSGEDFDPELGTPHLASAIFHSMTLMIFMQEHPEYDDRYKAKAGMTQLLDEIESATLSPDEIRQRYYDAGMIPPSNSRLLVQSSTSSPAEVHAATVNRLRTKFHSQ